MSAKKINKLKINLLPKDAYAESALGKVLNWCLSTGRYIVIFTELVVIFTFISRFYYDRKLSDLNESLQEKSQIINAYAYTENQVKAIQKKAAFIKPIEEKVRYAWLIKYLEASSPDDLAMEQISFGVSSFSFTGNVFSRDSFMGFVETLKKNPQFSSVNIGSIEQNQSVIGFNFSITVNLLSDGAADRRAE